MESGPNFSLIETNMLVKVFCDHDWQKKFDNHKKSQKSVWADMAHHLQDNFEIIRTSEQVKNKIKNLKKEYYRLKRLPTGSGQDNWPYYDDFSKLYGTSAIVQPVLVVDSLEDVGVLMSVEDDMVSTGGESGDLESGWENEVSGSGSDATETTPRPIPSREAVRLSVQNSRKRKTPASQIYDFLKKSEDDDKVFREESKKRDDVVLNFMEKMNEHMAQLVELKKQKLETAQPYQYPFFQPVRNTTVTKLPTKRATKKK